MSAALCALALATSPLTFATVAPSLGLQLKASRIRFCKSFPADAVTAPSSYVVVPGAAAYPGWGTYPLRHRPRRHLERVGRGDKRGLPIRFGNTVPITNKTVLITYKTVPVTRLRGCEVVVEVSSGFERLEHRRPLTRLRLRQLHRYNAVSGHSGEYLHLRRPVQQAGPVQVPRRWWG